MDFAITTDGISGQMTWDKAEDNNLRNNVFLSLAVRRGSFFQNPDFGSRLHLIVKKTDANVALAGAYAREALAWIVQLGRAARIDVRAEAHPNDPHRMRLLIEVEKRDGTALGYAYFIEVI